jgi:PAS domain S-box-containing protein
MPIPASVNFFLIFQILTCDINFFVLFLVSTQFFKSRSGRAYLPITTFVALWSLTDIFCTTAPSLAVADFWERVGCIPAIFLSHALIYFVLAFAFPAWVNSKLKKLLLFLPAMIISSLLLFTPLFEIRAVSTSWGYNIADTWTAISLGFYISGLSFVAILIGLASLKKLENLQKTQMKYFLFGFIIPLIGGAFTEVLAPVIHVQMTPLTSPLCGVTSLVILYTIRKFGFLSISPALALEQVFNSLHDALMVTDQAGKIVLVNTEASHITNLSRIQLLEKKITDLIHHPDGTQLTLKNLLDSTWENTGMLIHRYNASASVPILLSCSQIVRTNTLHGLVLVARDMSQTDELVRHLEEKTGELEKSKAELEKTIATMKSMNDLMVGRELRIIELKKKLAEATNSPVPASISNL